jgi:anti-sigma-K factor RskA
LKLAAKLPDLEMLKSELQNFQVKISDSGHDTYDARSGAHDDLKCMPQCKQARKDSWSSLWTLMTCWRVCLVLSAVMATAAELQNIELGQ